MKRLLTLISFMLLCQISVSAQMEEPNWLLLQEQDNFNIYYGVGSCGEMDRMWIKAENARDSIAFSHLDLEITDGDQIYQAGPVMFETPANSTLILGCEDLPPHIMEQPIIISNRESFNCSVAVPNSQPENQ